MVNVIHSVYKLIPWHCLGWRLILHTPRIRLCVCNGLIYVTRVVTVDGSGNVYVTGYTQGALDSQPYAGSDDIALFKYNAAGDWQWTRLKGSSSNDAAFGGEEHCIRL